MIDSVGRAHRRADCAVLGALAIMAVSAVSAKEFTQYTYESNLLQNLPTSVEVTASQFALSRAHRAAEAECLAEVMYYEARGEGVDGEKAVAEVVLQRVKNLDYPKTVCGVVYDGVQPDRRECQFSFACDGSLRRPRDKAAWQRMRVLAERIMTGDVKLSGITHNATAYHSVDVTPEWADGMLQTAQVGNHVFYKRDPSAQARLAQAEMATPIETLTGFFSATAEVPIDVTVPIERIQPQVQIPAVLRDGA
jgi:spore germination cell wall hydrolase CwlJ-like protein